MRTIVFATQKGGCGKSTLAICLAVAAQEAGERVAILDLDPKKSLVRWNSKRTGLRLPVKGIPLSRLRGTLTDLAARKTSLVIVDTPPMESPISLAAIKIGDLSIVPTRPATFDIWASEVTGRKLRLMDKDFVFLLNQCPSARQDAIVQNAAAALNPIGTLLGPYIRARADFPEAAHMGKGVTELHSKGLAAKEMRALWLAIDHRLRPARARQTKPISRRSSW